MSCLLSWLQNKCSRPRRRVHRQTTLYGYGVLRPSTALADTLLRNVYHRPYNKQVIMGWRRSMARVSPLTVPGSIDNERAVRGDGSTLNSGACTWAHHIRDEARVLYFDDPLLDDVAAITSWRCAGLRRCLCGGRGQAIRVQRPTCCGWCLRTRGLAGLPCVPMCCACMCRAAVLSYDIPAKVNNQQDAPS